MINSNIAISDSGLVFNPATGESFLLNEVGLEILMQVRKNLPKEEICKIILEGYEIDSDTVERDISEFIYSLTRNQIITGNNN